MLMQRQQSEQERLAFERALSDELVAASALTFLEQRVKDLEQAAGSSARAALINKDNSASALIIEGQLREAKSWLDIVKRYLETGTTSMKRPAHSA